MNYDRVLIYNWANQRWTTGTVTAQVYAQLASVGLDLDTDGTEVGDSNLDSTAQSLDSFAYIGGRPSICAIDATGLLGSLNGPNLKAQLETTDAHLVPGQRAFVSEVYPLIDSPDVVIASAPRERLQDAVAYGADTPLEVTGSVSLYTSGRLHRFRATVPAGSVWTLATGLGIDSQSDGYA